MLRRLVEAEPGEDLRGTCGRGVRGHVGEPHLDLGDTVRIAGVLRFAEQRGALAVGGEHPVDEAFFAAGRLLGDVADARGARHRDRSAFGRELARDELQQRRLARAVAADEADLVPVGDRGGSRLEDRPPLDAERSSLM